MNTFMFAIKKTDIESIEELRNSYYTNVIAPMDDMWESGIIPGGDFYTIEKENIFGYFVVDADNTLMQFFIKEEYENEAQDAFEFIKKQNNINTAFVSTYEPRYLSLCLDKNNGVEVNSILYIEMKAAEIKKPLESITSDFATMEELDAILAYDIEKVGIPDGDWLAEYTKYLI